MPALNEEIEETLSEGININNSWGPKAIVTENGKVTGVEFKKCISVFDENKRFNPIYDENDILFVKAESSAHLVARVCPERVILFKGRFVSGEFR